MGFKENGFESASPKPRVELEIFVWGGPICVTNLLSIQTSIHIHKYIHLHIHTHTQFSIFHSEILKI